MGLDRRHVLLGFGFAGLAAITPAVAGGRVLRAVRVDTSGLAARGLPNYAARVAAMVEPRVRQVFAGQVDGRDRSAPTLVLRINTVLLAGDPAPTRGRGLDFMDRPRDQIDGDGVLLDGAGRVVASKHVYTTADADGAGPTILPQNEVLRVARLGEVFARWVKSELAL